MNINLDFNQFFQSKKFKIAIAAILGLILLLLAFGAGTFVGLKKANFSFRWAENYHQNFAGPRNGFMGGFFQEFEERDFINAHGIIGQIIKIDGSNILIEGRDNVEKIIVVKNETVIRDPQKTITPADLKTGEYIIVVGEPSDSGQIEAKLIRVMPAPPISPSLSPSSSPSPSPSKQ